MKRLDHFLIAAVMALSFVAPSRSATNDTGDPFIWLEDVRGQMPLRWAAEQNAVTEKALKGDPNYETLLEKIRRLNDADDRLPGGNAYGKTIFNFWQDAAHVRGIWRRTTISSYESGSPEWEMLIDVDKLAAEEGKNWTFGSPLLGSGPCTRTLKRCLIRLSLGGADRAVVREFDLTAKQFLPDGFTLPSANSSVAYIDDDTIIFGTDFGPNSLTSTGLPRIIKVWRRGQMLSEAKQIFEAPTESLGVSAWVTPSGIPIIFHTLIADFFPSERFVMQRDRTLIKLPIPISAMLRGEIRNQLILTLRQDWTPEGGKKIARGSLIAFPVNEFLTTQKMPRVSVLYTPDARSMVNQVQVGQDAVYASIYSDVKGEIHAFRHDAQSGMWSNKRLDIPRGGTTRILSADPFGQEAYFTYESFLAPPTLYAARGDAKPAVLKRLPDRFDSTPYTVTQYEAISKDGTHIPYSVVRARNLRGPVPTMLVGYGGYEIPELQDYVMRAGQMWLPNGGAYALANIRGGGEFGPAWHEAAMKTNRQRAFDDFIAIAEDMIKHGLTTPKQLGIYGGSNGGLLVGTVAVERPDLFGAVVCEAPLLDMIRFPRIGALASAKGEFGDPDNPEERAALLKYSPYQNVKAGVRYPPFLFLTATSDDRVTPADARKMAAKMEALGQDVLFWETPDGGHAGAVDNSKRAELTTLVYIYFAQKLGLTTAAH